MDFDKLHAALKDEEVVELFCERGECLAAITQAEGHLIHLREQLAEIQGKIADKVGGGTKPADAGSRAPQKCSDCEKLGIDNGGHHKRAGAQHDKWMTDNRPRLVAEGKLKEAA